MQKSSYVIAGFNSAFDKLSLWFYNIRKLGVIEKSVLIYNELGVAVNLLRLLLSSISSIITHFDLLGHSSL